MKHAITSIILASLTTIASASGNRPVECSNAAELLEAYDCPSPYVELMPPPDGDEIFERGWWCVETDHALGKHHFDPHHPDRYGKCSSGYRPGIVGWHASDPYLTPAHQAVIMPCLRDALSDAGAVPASMTLNEAAILAWRESKHLMQPFEHRIANHLRDMPPASHAEFLALARAECYAAVVESL